MGPAYNAMVWTRNVYQYMKINDIPSRVINSLVMAWMFLMLFCECL